MAAQDGAGIQPRRRGGPCAEVAHESRTGQLGGPSCWGLEQRSHLLPLTLFNKIIVLPMRRNEDLEALFVLSCGLGSRELLSLGAQP